MRNLRKSAIIKQKQNYFDKFVKKNQMNEKLLKIINSIKKNKQDKPVETLTEEMRLREDLNLDSFDLAELTVKIEDEFDIDIFEEGLVLTVGEILNKLP